MRITTPISEEAFNETKSPMKLSNFSKRIASLHSPVALKTHADLKSPEHLSELVKSPSRYQLDISLPTKNFNLPVLMSN
jgi:hypothetical protein